MISTIASQVKESPMGFLDRPYSLARLANMKRRVVINMHEAKTTLSKLVEQACAGDEVFLARAGKPAVQLVPVSLSPKRRSLGVWKGKVKMSDDFDAPLPRELEEAFGGNRK